MHRSLRIVLLFVLLSGTAHGQYFGKNKVQYTDFDWRYVQSQHFDVYFANDGYDIAVFTARAAEEALLSIQRSFRYQIAARVPIIVYNSHNDFQQTNVVGTYLEEGIGGVTELFKNRVVIPFEGTYRAFRHVLHHELVHAVLNDMFYGGSFQAAVSNRIQLQLPLWANEGMAEYQSRDGWDVESDMFIRDATTSNYLPPIPYLGGYFAYRGGQSVWWYIADTYGKEKVGEVLNNIRTSRSMNAGLQSSIGLTLEELSERWQREMKKRYFPDVAKRESPNDFAKRLTDHKESRSFYNTSPAISPRGDRVAFISNRSDYFGVYIMSAIDGKDVELLVEGSNTADFEELHLLTPGISWSPDGRSIVFASKAGANDAINIIEVESGEWTKLPVARDGIYSVQWSPDGKKLAYQGNDSRQSDIWVYDLEARTSTNLTRDIFSDEQPSWSPDSRTIYFISDRRQYLSTAAIPEDFDIFDHDYSQTDLYSIDIESGRMRRITNTPHYNESYPLADPEGRKLLYISDRNGINNLYIRELDTGTEYPITNSLSGIHQLSLTADGERLAFASMFEAAFDIFVMKSPFTQKAIDDLEPTAFRAEQLQEWEAELTGDEIVGADAPRSEGDDDSVAVAAISAERFDKSEEISISLGRQEPEADTTEAAGYAGRMLFTKKGMEQAAEPTASAQMLPSKFLDEDGNFRINKYKLSFTADMVYGNAGFSSFYGVMGTAQMTFSDMLGNHRIIVATNLIGDLKNSDYAFAYLYLPDRIDWGIHGFHSARFLYGPSRTFYEDLYRYRQYGVGLTASFSLDKFNRLEATGTLLTISQENLDDPLFGTAENTMILPNVGFVHDNTLWGGWAPMRGTRYEVRATGSPGLGSTSLEFVSLSFDYRKYFKFWDDYTFVLRGAGGGSFGKNAQRFFIGGTENWINPRYETGRIPINSAEDFAFLTAVLPLRGFNYNARIAQRFMLMNAELRFPLVKYFLGGFLPYILQSINGAMFVDIGAAMDDFNSFKGYKRTEFGGTIYNDLLIGTGFGTRVWFLGFPFRFDIAWPYLGAGFGEPRYYFSLGADF